MNARRNASVAICRSRRFETGHGTCSLFCMEALGDPRKKGCGNAERMFGEIADSVLADANAIIRDLLEYIDYLEIHGGCCTSGATEAAEAYLGDAA